MLATGCSERGKGLLAEPLPRIQPLLLGRVDDPLLALSVGHFGGNRLEPERGLLDLTNSSPQLAHEVSKDCPLLSRDGIVRP